MINKILISIVLIISLMGSALALDVKNGVEMRPGEAAAENLFNHGIGHAWAGGSPPPLRSNDMKFSQFYSFNKGSSSRKHIEAPKKHEITHEIPSTVYFNYQMQAVPYTQYKTYSAFTGSNSLWIQGGASWTQYTQVPEGSSLSLLAISSLGGSGYLYETYPGGRQFTNGFYFFPGGNQIAFNADIVGEHILYFIINGQVSNSIVIDVVPFATPYRYPTLIPSVQPHPQGTILPPL